MKDIDFFRLEDRVLFEAAAAAEIVAAADAAAQAQESFETDHDEQDQYAVSTDTVVNNAAETQIETVLPEALADVDSELDALIEGVIPGSADIQTDKVSAVLQDNGKTLSSDRELVVIDSAVKDIASVTSQLRPDQDVLILEKDNGIAEITDYLRDAEGRYSAIHLVTHGDNDGIVINDEVITAKTFNADEWAEFRQYLTEDGDILFYGCNIAENANGQALIDQIAAASGADVAASIDTTGIAGNWDLEYTAGCVESAALSVSNYSYNLAAPIVSSYSELYDALEAAAQTGSDHTIIISSNIDISENDDIYIYVENDLNLTIKGIDDTIDLRCGDNVRLFNFYDSDDYNIEITIENLNFDGQGSAATAVNASGVEKLTISNSKIENFTDSSVIHYGYGGEESLIINNVEFTGNKPAYFSGGAISTMDVSVYISDSCFSGNSSAQNGGALSIQNAPLVSISNTTFYNNSASFNGGAADIVIGTNGVVEINNSTFYLNSAGNGGALNIEHSDNTSSVTISNSTFAANTVGANGEGSALYNAGGSNTKLINSLFVGVGDSVVAQQDGGSMTLSYSLATSVDGSGITLGAGAEVSSEFTHANIFGSNTYDIETHTIAPDAYYKAAWSGTITGDGLDQLGNDREAINTVTGLTGKYSVGAVTAAAGLIVVQGDSEVFYTGSEIPVPEAVLKDNLKVFYAENYYDDDPANDIELSKDITGITWSSDPDPIQAAGNYTISVSDAIIAGITAADNVAYRYVDGTLTVKLWDNFTVAENTFESIYGETVDLTSTYTFTTQDKITGDDIKLTVTVEWEIDSAVITAGNYSSSGYINFGEYEDSLTVKDFTVVDENGKDMKDFYVWDDSTLSNVKIEQRELTVTAGQGNITYGDAIAPEYTLGGLGLAAGDSINNVSYAVSGEVSTSGNYIAGTHTVSIAGYNIADGNGGNNYRVTLQSSDFNIGRLPVTVTIDGSKFNKDFDGNTETEVEDRNYTIHTLIDGDQVTAEGTYEYDSIYPGNDRTVTMSNITLVGADAGNYELLNDTASDNGASINPIPVTYHVYCEGLYPGHFSVMPAMQADMLANHVEADGLYYTMPYSELVNKTMLDYIAVDNMPAENAYSNIVNADALKYHPLTIDEPVREISETIVGGSNLTHEAALYSGEELFVNDIADGDTQLFKWRGETLSEDHEPIFIEEGSLENKELASGYVLRTETVEVPGGIFVKDNIAELEFNDIAILNERQISKVENLKSSLEKLLDKLCLA